MEFYSVSKVESVLLERWIIGDVILECFTLLLYSQRVLYCSTLQYVVMTCCPLGVPKWLKCSLYCIWKLKWSTQFLTEREKKACKLLHTKIKESSSSLTKSSTPSWIFIYYFFFFAESQGKNSLHFADSSLKCLWLEDNNARSAFANKNTCLTVCCWALN